MDAFFENRLEGVLMHGFNGVDDSFVENIQVDLIHFRPLRVEFS